MIKNILSELRQQKYFLKKVGIFFLFFCIVLFSLATVSGNFYSFLSEKAYVPRVVKHAQKNLEGKIFFNDSPNTKIFTDLLVNALQSTRESIDIAVYSFNHEQISKALFRAAEQGKSVHMILDSEKEKTFSSLYGSPSGISVSYRGNSSSSAYMHHKFLLVDSHTESPKLFMGSFNFTDLQESYDPSFIAEFEDSEIISAFAEEYELLASGVSGYKKLRTEGYKPFAKRLEYENGFFEIWFGPGFKENSIKERTLDLIKNAKKSIQIIIWRFNDRDIMHELFQKAKAGVQISILTDDYYLWSEDSILPELVYQIQKNKFSNVEIVSDFVNTLDLKGEIKVENQYFNPYLHQHTLLVDGNTVLSGTNNWTDGGFNKNDESIFISDVPFLVEGFQKSFVTNYEAIRKSKLEYTREGNTLIFENMPEEFLGATFAIYQEESEKSIVPDACFKSDISSRSQTFVIPENCLGEHSLALVFDASSHVLGGNYLSF